MHVADKSHRQVSLADITPRNPIGVYYKRIYRYTKTGEYEGMRVSLYTQHYQTNQREYLVVWQEHCSCYEFDDEPFVGSDGSDVLCFTELELKKLAEAWILGDNIDKHLANYIFTHLNDLEIIEEKQKKRN